MGDPGRTKSSELDRSASHRASRRLSNILGEDDDCDLAAMAVSDGFRPAGLAHEHEASHAARPSVSSLEPPDARAASPRPSSVFKPPHAHESFPHHHNISERDSIRSGASTDTPVISAETPYEGPVGPSHPYQMYPQDVRLARTASLATSSTAAVSERSYVGPHRPAHLYGAYSQNVAAGDDEPGDRSPLREITVGFPGTGGAYQRRLGPDGEEAADMIGPDGHTEQLPPYTRYPMEAYARKDLGIGLVQPAPASPTTQQNLEIPGAGGIGLATRDPEFASSEDLNRLGSAQCRQSIRSFTSEASHHSINTAALTVVNEKSTPNWKAAARRKVWGIPCWVVALGVIVLVMLGVVVGTVIGTQLVRHFKKDKDDDNPSYPENGTGPGLIPLSLVPPGLPPLAEGQYLLPLGSPRYSRNCLKDTNQSRAWSCDAIMSQLTMNITRRPDSEEISAYTLDFGSKPQLTMERFVYSYGVQPPSLTDQQLSLVNDTYELGRGAAWAFARPYDKTIILPENTLSPSDNVSSKEVRRRMMFGFDFNRKEPKIGEKPWICEWPGTLLEVIIYAYQNSSSANYLSPSSSAATPSSPTPSESSTGGKSYNGYRRNPPMGPGGNDHDDDDDDYPRYSPTPTPTPQPTSPPSPTPPPSESSTTTTPAPSSESSYSSHPPVIPAPPFRFYPRVIKVEERRNHNIDAPMPTCRQVEIQGDGLEAQPVPDGKGGFVEIQIVEKESDDDEKVTDPYVFRRHFSEHLRERDDGGSEGNELSDCGCIWWVT
ncbi:hypothetical protein F4777DRAFT_155360 [Nemania sp. FL0916]|nr:hypothetical protein F4777DRAFT_155360 [Nemania sp. FL0916]